VGLAIVKIPDASVGLIEVRNLPITVEPNEKFHLAKSALTAIVTQASSIVNAITTDDQYNLGIALIKQIRTFRKQAEAGVKPAKDSLNNAKDELMGYIHELDDPAAKIEKALQVETARYAEWKEQERLKEEQRRREEEERKRKAEQRRLDLQALRHEISAAQGEIARALSREEEETAKEILAVVEKFDALDSTPEAFRDPVANATAVRQAVANAKMHQAARIAAAKAKEAGDKAAARRIEKAAATTTAEVAPVVVEQEQAAPVAVPKVELGREKGQHLKIRWLLDRISERAVVPMRFWIISEKLLQDYADQQGENEPKVPGVIFKREAKTTGIRG
jgi:chromosome segregation ATPase